MIVFRITKTKYANDLSGAGSTLVEGRWHLAGTFPVLYTSSNRSLAILEVLAHLPSPVVKSPKLTLLQIFVPDANVIVLKENELPKGWTSKRYQRSVQQWGTEWLGEMSSLAIAVPSAISHDSNILINPRHRDIRKVKILKGDGEFELDERLI